MKKIELNGDLTTNATRTQLLTRGHTSELHGTNSELDKAPPLQR